MTRHSLANSVTGRVPVVSVTKMSEAGEHHRDAGGISSGDHLRITDRSSRLDDGRDTGFFSRFPSFGGGKERTRSGDGAESRRLLYPRRPAGLRRSRGGYPDGV